MATINWHGTHYAAEPIQQLPNGDWLMKALDHGARFTVGTQIQVKQSDIVSMDAAEMPPDPAGSAAAVETAMAEERKTIPTVRELLLKAAKDKADAAKA